MFYQEGMLPMFARICCCGLLLLLAGCGVMPLQPAQADAHEAPRPRAIVLTPLPDVPRMEPVVAQPTPTLAPEAEAAILAAADAGIEQIAPADMPAAP
jgi:hypothetical protein